MLASFMKCSEKNLQRPCTLIYIFVFILFFWHMFYFVGLVSDVFEIASLNHLQCFILAHLNFFFNQQCVWFCLPCPLN